MNETTCVADSLEISVGKDFVIPAGTFIILQPGRKPPDHTMLLCGQKLPRQSYPELSEIYPGGMATSEVELPDFENKVLFDFNDDGTPVFTSIAIYYESLPEESRPKDRTPDFMKVD